MRTVSNMDVRKENTSAIRRVLLDGAIHSRDDLAAATRLSIGTCRNILDDLLSAGEVVIEDNGKSTGGRPALRFRYAPDCIHYLLLRLKVERSADDFEMRVVENILTDALKYPLKFGKLF